MASLNKQVIDTSGEVDELSMSPPVEEKMDTIDIEEQDHSNVFDEKVLTHSTVLASGPAAFPHMASKLEKCNTRKTNNRRGLKGSGPQA